MKLTCVMVVDDSEGDQFIAEIAIQDYDPEIKILQAYDGLEALNLLNSDEPTPELILLDINMPRMDGHEFLEAYTKQGLSKSTIIGMLTSSAQEDDKKRTMAYESVKSYLHKPISATDIEAVAKLV